MTTSIQAVRGMNDILPTDTPIWQTAELCFRQALVGFGYQEIRLPIVEQTELFKRSVGEFTDIVEKEMYTFADRNGDSLTLRPEGTAGCVRAALQHGLLHNQIQRLWYMGPLFRHERPQKGRYRQFYQCGAEAFGIAGPDIDVELILLSADILQRLGLKDLVTLEINSIGSIESRKNYLKELTKFLEKQLPLLDEDSKRRLNSNPLRILDSKNPKMQVILADAPCMSDFLDEESKSDLQDLCHQLTALDITFKLNTRLVRGLDYYTNTVFEWTTTSHTGAQNAICAGGRYDKLIADLGGKASFGSGFAFGMDRIILLMQETKQKIKDTAPHAYIISDNKDSHIHSLKIAYQLRIKYRNLRLVVHAGGGNIKNQFRKADRSGAEYVLIFGETELINKTVTLKPLRKKDPQITFNEIELFVETSNIEDFTENNFFDEIYTQNQPSGRKNSNDRIYY